MTDTKHIEHVLLDTTEDVLTIEEHTPTLMGGIATFYIVRDTSCSSWCPNALQLRALRDRCNAILAQHAKKDPGPYRALEFTGIGGATIEIESGQSIPGAHVDAVIRIDIQGNEEGPSWVGNLDDLAHLASAIDDVWDEHNPAPTDTEDPAAALADVRRAFVSVGFDVGSRDKLMRWVRYLIGNNTDLLNEEVALNEFNDAVAKRQDLQDALDSLDDGIVADDAGNLCLTYGKVIAIAQGDGMVWLKRIAAIVNAVVEARDNQ